jgi:hypothetical protein
LRFVQRFSGLRAGNGAFGEELKDEMLLLGNERRLLMTEGRLENEVFPTHQDIERRAYKIYLEREKEDGHADEHWFIAEAELLRKRGEREAGPLKSPTVIAGAGGVAKTDFAAADEEMSKAGSTEKLKEQRDGSTVPRGKTVSVGQQREKK